MYSVTFVSVKLVVFIHFINIDVANQDWIKSAYRHGVMITYDIDED